MSVQFKIINGATPKTGKSICLTCKNGTVIKGQNCEELVVCNTDLFAKTKGIVPFRVAECGRYHPSNMPWLYEMEEMAWKIEARKRGPVGFDKGGDGEMELIITPPAHDRNTPE